MTIEERKIQRKIWDKKSYERRKVDIKAKYASGYYKENRDPIKRKEWDDKWRKENKDRINAMRREKKFADLNEDSKQLHNKRVKKYYERVKNTLEYKQRTKEYELRVAYGIGLADYEAMLIKQNFMCAICSKKHEDTHYGRLAVDHCHETKLVRGLLCRRCNHGLGNFKDNLASMYNAIAYIKRSMQ